jgi:hypothetical protein
MKPGGLVFRPREEEKMEQYRVIHGLTATGSPEAEMTARGVSKAGGVRRESESEMLLLPPPAISSPYTSPRLSPRDEPHVSPGLSGRLRSRY